MKGSISKFSPWGKIHAPLPRTPRQSQQLLNSLTSSFRRELDRQHPTSADSNAPNTESSIEEHPHSSAHATDKHLRTILENPLFRVAPPRPVASPRSFLNIENSRWAKEPMVVLDELVAAGSATPGAIAHCLSWQMLLVSTHKGEGFVEALRGSRAGSRVVSWWYASNPVHRAGIFPAESFPGSESRTGSGKLLVDLTKFMVAEGLHDTLFDWLRMLKNRNLGNNKRKLTPVFAHKAITTLLGNFLKAETVCGGGHNSAIQHYLKASELLTTATEGDQQLELERALTKAGAFICKSILLDSPEDISPQSYERYAATMLAMAPSTAMLGATVVLCHPTQPDPRPFVRYLRNSSWIGLPSTKRRERYMAACSRALCILKERGNREDCLFLEGVMRQEMEEYQGLTPTTNPHCHPSSRNHVSSEEKDLLDSLDLAFT
ncbi:hypothetical protein BJY01DRAFT_25106 [Aspergillus pseudoustus]|uniref:Uncharacterized protein n=1 Tax=Aspergillus pseudoustus TaxID=1810923 RepID=A0ABR4KRD5_9EURO